MAGVPASSRSGGGATVLSYVQFTADVTISGTSAALGQTIVTAAPVTVGGATLICVEFYTAGITVGAAGGLFVELYRDATETAVLVYVIGVAGSSLSAPALARQFLTPAAGTYTYSLRGWRSTANGAVKAGDGLTGNLAPGYIRITSGS